jgi:hypothetical protein
MTAATLVRTRHGAQQRARETYDTDVQVETLYSGDLAGAILAARAIPAAERIDTRIETEAAFYGPDDFDTMTPDQLPMRDLDLMHGSGIVRIERAALELLRGDRAGLVPPMTIVGEHIETITAIVQHKKLTEDVEDLDGKRLVRITAADVAAA